MKLFTSVAAIMTAFAMYSPFSNAFTDVTDTNVKQTFEQKVEKGETVVLTFTAAWCPNCKEFAPMLDKAEKANPKVLFMRIDIDKSPELGSKVPAVPTTVIFKNKKIVDVLVGRAPDQKSLDARLKKALGK